MKEIKVVELFAGVGGFRIGLSRASDKFKVVWSSQWEPSTKSQEASDIYIKRFGEQGHSNEDIASVPTEKIPEHNLIVGGFPCQDYSVARTLNQSGGIQGKKGVLWWQIHRILEKSKHKPEYIFLENVDRLIKSPAKQRGRDFAIMLASLSDLGYAVEWRIINAADYGFPQRRRRIFFIGYHKSTSLYQNLKKENKKEWIESKGVLAEAFKINQEKSEKESIFQIEGDLLSITENFNKNKKNSPFENSGVMIGRNVFSIKTHPNFNGRRILLKDIILEESQVPKNFFINKDNLKKWEYLKGAKKEERFNKKHNVKYFYSEGAMIFPDNINAPSRTIVTGEGGSAPSRFKHVIKTSSGKFRRLTPLELERLNMFPDNHTEGCTDIKRAFLMGNALVVGAIEQVGKVLAKRISE